MRLKEILLIFALLIIFGNSLIISLHYFPVYLYEPKPVDASSHVVYDKIGKEQAIEYLIMAKDSHLQFLDNPEWRVKYTGNKTNEAHDALWVVRYNQIIDYIRNME